MVLNLVSEAVSNDPNGVDEQNIGSTLKLFDELNERECKLYSNDVSIQNALQLLLKFSLLCTFSEAIPDENNFLSNLNQKEKELLEFMKKNLENQFLTESYCSELFKLIEDILPLDIIKTTNYEQFQDVIVSISPFLKRTEVLLSLGGDDRLTINFKGDKLNKYHSSTLPRENLILRGSCTCSTLSLQRYFDIDAMRVQFLESVFSSYMKAQQEEKELSFKNHFASSFMNANDVLRQKLLNVVVGSDSSAQVITCPSGSDAEYLALIIALIRSFNLNKKDQTKIKVFSYVTAAGEVGSGTAMAAGGRSFSKLSPTGNQQTIDACMEGMNEGWVEVKQFKPREGVDGDLKLKEDEIRKTVYNDLSSNDTAVAVLHVVLGSKTGLVYPSQSVVESLKKSFGDRVLVTVDACQLRCKMTNIRAFVEAGYVTLITGSKFYCGAPFSGGIVLPASVCSEIEEHLGTCNNVVIPTGLREYLTSYDIPAAMENFRNFMCYTSNKSEESEWLNFGSYLRWSGAAKTIQEYNSLSSAKVKAFTVQWVKNIQTLVTKHNPYLTLFDDQGSTDMSPDMHMQFVGSKSGILSIALNISENGMQRALDIDECKKFFKLMTLPLTYGENLTHEPFAAYLGQPVKLGSNGFAIVRIALGADVVIEALSSSDSAVIGNLLKDEEKLVSKMAWIVKNWCTISQEY